MPVPCSASTATGYQVVVDAHRAHRNAQVSRAQRFEEVFAYGAAALAHKADHVAGCVIARESGKVEAGDGAQKPGGLPLFLDCAAGGEGSCPALDRAPVDARAIRQSRSRGVPGLRSRLCWGLSM